MAEKGAWLCDWKEKGEEIMHLAFMIRGHKHWQDRFINELATRYLPFKMYNPEKKVMEDKIIEMRLCPIQLYDATFPADQFDIVANSILCGGNGDPNNPSMKKFIWALRKMMGFKKLPEYKKDTKFSMSPPEHQEIFAIGVKDDFFVEPDGRHVEKKDKSPLAWEGI